MWRTGQFSLGRVWTHVEDRSSFGTMLDWTHLAAAVFKVGFSYIGFLTFGDDTQEVITNNLDQLSLLPSEGREMNSSFRTTV